MVDIINKSFRLVQDEGEVELLGKNIVTLKPSELLLRYCYLSDKYLTRIIESCLLDENLIVLDLSGNSMGEDALSVLLSLLNSNKCIETLNILANPILQSLPGGGLHPHLEELLVLFLNSRYLRSICGCSVSKPVLVLSKPLKYDHEIEVIKAELRKNTDLKSLSCVFNEHIQGLLSVLDVSKTLVRLHFEGFHNAAPISAALGLSLNTSLRTLQIKWNEQSSSKDAESLMLWLHENLIANHCLTTLQLDGVPLHLDLYEWLAEVLEHNKGLLHVSLLNTPWTVTSKCRMLASLGINSTLRVFRVAGSGVDAKVWGSVENDLRVYLAPTRHTPLIVKVKDTSHYTPFTSPISIHVEMYEAGEEVDVVSKGNSWLRGEVLAVAAEYTYTVLLEGGEIKTNLIFNQVRRTVGRPQATVLKTAQQYSMDKFAIPDEPPQTPAHPPTNTHPPPNGHTPSNHPHAHAQKPSGASVRVSGGSHANAHSAHSSATAASPAPHRPSSSAPSHVHTSPRTNTRSHTSHQTQNSHTTSHTPTSQTPSHTPVNTPAHSRTVSLQGYAALAVGAAVTLRSRGDVYTCPATIHTIHPPATTGTSGSATTSSSPVVPVVCAVQVQMLDGRVVVLEHTELDLLYPPDLHTNALSGADADPGYYVRGDYVDVLVNFNLQSPGSLLEHIDAVYGQGLETKEFTFKRARIAQDNSNGTYYARLESGEDLPCVRGLNLRHTFKKKEKVEVRGVYGYMSGRVLRVEGGSRYTVHYSAGEEGGVEGSRCMPMGRSQVRLDSLTQWKHTIAQYVASKSAGAVNGSSAGKSHTSASKEERKKMHKQKVADQQLLAHTQQTPASRPASTPAAAPAPPPSAPAQPHTNTPAIAPSHTSSAATTQHTEPAEKQPRHTRKPSHTSNTPSSSHALLPHTSEGDADVSESHSDVHPPHSKSHARPPRHTTHTAPKQMQNSSTQTLDVKDEGVNTDPVHIHSVESVQIPMLGYSPAPSRQIPMSTSALLHSTSYTDEKAQSNSYASPAQAHRRIHTPREEENGFWNGNDPLQSHSHGQIDVHTKGMLDMFAHTQPHTPPHTPFNMFSYSPSHTKPHTPSYTHITPSHPHTKHHTPREFDVLLVQYASVFHSQAHSSNTYTIKVNIPPFAHAHMMHAPTEGVVATLLVEPSLPKHSHSHQLQDICNMSFVDTSHLPGCMVSEQDGMVQWVHTPPPINTRFHTAALSQEAQFTLRISLAHSHSQNLALVSPTVEFKVRLLVCGVCICVCTIHQGVDLAPSPHTHSPIPRPYTQSHAHAMPHAMPKLSASSASSVCILELAPIHSHTTLQVRHGVMEKGYGGAYARTLQDLGLSVYYDYVFPSSSYAHARSHWAFDLLSTPITILVPCAVLQTHTSREVCGLYGLDVYGDAEVVMVAICTCMDMCVNKEDATHAHSQTHTPFLVQPYKDTHQYTKSKLKLKTPPDMQHAVMCMCLDNFTHTHQLTACVSVLEKCVSSLSSVHTSYAFPLHILVWPVDMASSLAERFSMLVSAPTTYTQQSYHFQQQEDGGWCVYFSPHTLTSTQHTHSLTSQSHTHMPPYPTLSQANVRVYEHSLVQLLCVTAPWCMLTLACMTTHIASRIARGENPRISTGMAVSRGNEDMSVDDCYHALGELLALFQSFASVDKVYSQHNHQMTHQCAEQAAAILRQYTQSTHSPRNASAQLLLHEVCGMVHASARHPVFANPSTYVQRARTAMAYMRQLQEMQAT